MKEMVLNTLLKLKQWWQKQSKRRRVAYTAIVFIVLIFVLKNGSPNSTSVETVKRTDLTKSVTASGKVVSQTDLSLGFEQSKVVRSVRVNVGDKVNKGDILATLSNGSEWASVSSAKGALLIAQAKYKKVIEGSTNEEIALAKVNYENAKKDLENVTKVQNGLVENARRKLNSEGLVATTTSVSSSTPTISGLYSGVEGVYRITLNYSGDGGYASFDGLESGNARASISSPQPLGTKGLYILFANGLSQPATWTVSIPNTTSSSYVVNLNAYNAAKDTRDDAISSAQAKVDQTEAELNLKRATARQADVDVALAEVVTAQAGLDQANANFEKTILRAPAPGTITKVNIKVGELAEINKEAIALQDVTNLYLEANINESNIRDVSVGQSVRVTFDAFGLDTYYATLSSIDPAATITNNVVNYKVKALLQDTKNIRPGMSANMVITTNQIPQVLVLPGRVITTKGGQSTVLQILNERRKKTVTKNVSLGLKGDGDMVEIKNGLSEGDKVLWIPPKSK